MSRPSSRSFLFLFLLGALAACGGGDAEAPRETVRDLAADLDLAEVEREPGLVDLGTSAARPLLRRGWSQDETDGNRTFVWSDGPESEIEFFLAAPRHLPLSLQGAPYQFPGAPAQEISLALNGRPAGRIGNINGRLDAGLTLQRQHLRAGMNRLVLRYAWTRSPVEATGGNSGDSRRLAMAWDLLRFGTGVDERSRPRAAGGRLALPFGWRMSTFLRLPPDAALSIEDLRSRDGRPGELRIGLQAEGGAEREVARLGSDEGPSTVELGEAGDGPVRISLTAIAGEAGGEGLLLRQPLIAALRPAEETLGQAAPATVAPAAFHPPAPARRPRNVIIYLVDALRADHLGCYGYRLPVSPRLDGFAREATLFRHAVAQAPWTRPSVVTVLTGLQPPTHGVQHRRQALSAEAVTLAERLRDHGYRTAGFVTNGNVARSFGLGQGFEIYRLLPGNHNAATDVNDRVAGWLDGWDGKAPFFFYLHTVEPHAPYDPPARFRQRFAAGMRDESLTRMRVLKQLHAGALRPTPGMRRDLLALYDAEVAANDAAFGDLIDLLVRRGLWEETMIVFLSDHGEEFLDHGGWEHGRSLHTEMLDIPLVVRIPGMGTGRVVERQAQHVDIVPTVLEALGLPVAAAAEGRSLLAAIAGGAAGHEDEEEVALSWVDEFSVRAAAVSTPAWRLIATRQPHAHRALYDRRTDPAERRDLSSGGVVRSGYLATWLRAADRPRAGTLRPTDSRIDRELRQRLQALGYGH
ncbi:MAG TPA: sulfatase [Thermoanaerobaculia bacterium]|jgi:arylsulfatase A-like enzyme|nr:sulfatase [Thermoanaerobaculia bacterium]